MPLTLPSRAVNIYYIILNINQIHRLHYFGFKTIIFVSISHSVSSNAHTTPVRICGEPYAHKFCADGL